MTKENDVSAVDKALAAAKARKAAKATKAPDAPTPEATSAPEADASAAKEAAKAAKKAERDASRAAKKAEREIAKAEKKAARDAKRAEKAAAKADRKPAHMSKVEKAAAKLPTINDNATRLLNEATTNFSLDQLSAIAEHIRHFVRTKSTERALSTKLTVGQVVRIVNGNPRFIGSVATVMKAQRIRCYVEVQGYDKRVYLFTSDVIPLTKAQATLVDEPEDQAAATGTEG